MLIAVLLAFRSRYRRLAWTFAAVTAFVYVASLTAFIRVLPHAIDDLLPVDLYLHAPWWLGYEIVLSLSVLGAIGLTAWARVDLRTRRTAGVAAVGVWIVLPVAMGVSWPALGVATLGIAIGLAVLELARRRPELTWVVPCVLGRVDVLALSAVPVYALRSGRQARSGRALRTTSSNVGRCGTSAASIGNRARTLEAMSVGRTVAWAGRPCRTVETATSMGRPGAWSSSAADRQAASGWIAARRSTIWSGIGVPSP